MSCADDRIRFAGNCRRLAALGAIVLAVAVSHIPHLGTRACAQSTDPVVTTPDEPAEDDGPIVSDSGVGYIDNAILGNQFRFRFDAAYHNVQPALLQYWRVNERFSVYAELRDWIAAGGTPGFAGNVLRYGLGTSLQMNDLDACHPLLLVTEFVGWTVLEGRTAITTPGVGTIFPDAAGDTIANAKVGLRWRWTGLTDIYCGYGFALTEQTWYDDVLRFELRRRF